jgi:hypothetical protein
VLRIVWPLLRTWGEAPARARQAAETGSEEQTAR